MSLRQRLLSQSTIIFGARLFGAALTFFVQVAIARFLGSQALGEYILVMATVNVVAVVMPLGFEATGTYFAAEYRAKGEGGCCAASWPAPISTSPSPAFSSSSSASPSQPCSAKRGAPSRRTGRAAAVLAIVDSRWSSFRALCSSA